MKITLARGSVAEVADGHAALPLPLEGVRHANALRELSGLLTAATTHVSEVAEVSGMCALEGKIVADYATSARRELQAYARANMVSCVDRVEHNSQ